MGNAVSASTAARAGGGLQCIVGIVKTARGNAEWRCGAELIRSGKNLQDMRMPCEVCPVPTRFGIKTCPQLLWISLCEVCKQIA